MDLHDLRNMRLVAECVTRAALARTESRGAHQREDFPRPAQHGNATRPSASERAAQDPARRKLREPRGSVRAGQTVLDGLRWIRAQRDPSLAIRFSCINANACKECMMRVDGKTVYACTTRLVAGEMRLEPLPNKN